MEALGVTAGASVVEVDVASGRRGTRETRVAEQIVALSGAEAATVGRNVPMHRGAT